MKRLCVDRAIEWESVWGFGGGEVGIGGSNGAGLGLNLCGDGGGVRRAWRV